jgi:RAB protein geranylgeranyltransferase component A
MEDDLPTQYDVIVVGTGIVITMKIGATVVFL